MTKYPNLSLLCLYRQKHLVLFWRNTSTLFAGRQQKNVCLNVLIAIPSCCTEAEKKVLKVHANPNTYSLYKARGAVAAHAFLMSFFASFLQQQKEFFVCLSFAGVSLQCSSSRHICSSLFGFCICLHSHTFCKLDTDNTNAEETRQLVQCCCSLLF